MKTVFHKSEERGTAEFGWLHSRHSFSFGRYYNPARMGFGLLRVLNDDSVEAGEGFGTHPHNNMEIISIPLEGELAHKDSMGSGSVIKPGDIQVMSAGTGITHSEFNNSDTSLVKFLQIWIIPKEQNIKPQYDQKYFSAGLAENKILKVASGKKEVDSLYIHQDAAVSLVNLSPGTSLNYKMNYKGNGAYVFVIEGSAEVQNLHARERDAVGVWETNSFDLSSRADSKFVIIEVPME